MKKSNDTKTEEVSETTSEASEFEDIVCVAQKYIEWYPEWDKDEALNIAISEYDCWGAIDSGKYNYVQLLGRL